MLSFKICYISHISRWHSSVYSSLDLPYDAVVMQGRLTYLHPCQSHPFCHFCFIFGRYDYIIISCVYGCAYMCVCVCVLSKIVYGSAICLCPEDEAVCVCAHIYACLLPSASHVCCIRLPQCSSLCLCEWKQNAHAVSQIHLWRLAQGRVCVCFGFVFCWCVCVCMTTAVGQLSFHGGRDTFDLIWLHQRAKNIHTTFLSDS